MKSIQEFKIDTWVRQYGPKCQTLINGSYASALSVNDLHNFSAQGSEAFDKDLKLTYGAVKGSRRLRERIAELHSSTETTLTADNVVITPGSIMANYLVLATICGPGDHVICQYPTYGQLYLLPRYSGVEVSLWAMKEDEDWIPSVGELAGMIKSNTKAIILNNPSNPTGTVLPREILESIITTARECNLTVFSDEVFSPLFYTAGPKPPPLVSLGYARSVSTGSVSKAHGLPGLRVGWVVTQDVDLMQKIVTARDYTTLSVSQLDDSVALFALSKQVLPALMQRNLSMCRESILIIEEFVKRNSQRCHWIKPSGAGTAFVQVLEQDGKPVDDVVFSARLAEEEGICVIPGGHCFRDDGTDDFRGYIRLTLGEPQRLRAALPTLEAFLTNYCQG